MIPPTIFEYVEQQEADFETTEIQLGENWFWNLRKHVQLIFHLKHGVFFTGENDYLRAFKAVMEPMLQLAYWTEDIEVKDVVFFIENADDRVLSFLVKKYHDEVYVREHDIDTLFDEITESDIDYGGALVQEGNKRPELLALNSIAFCDQTDIFGGPLGIKFNFSPSKLRMMKKAGWGDKSKGATISIEDLIVLATDEKEADGSLNNKKNRVPGKTIEVYIVRGDLPESFLKEGGSNEEYLPQVQIVAFYVDAKGKKNGVVLYRMKDDSEAMLFHTSQKIHGRALGRGVGEALVMPQVFTNWATIHKNKLLEAASKIIPYTDDESFDAKNNLTDVENLEVKKVAEGRTFGLIPTVGVANLAVFGESIEDWFRQAQLSGSAQDPLLGKEESAGTTFRGQERLVAQGRGVHDRRRGQRAKFIEEIYRKWIIPDIVREIVKGKDFLATLTADELTWVVESLATKDANQRIKRALIDGKMLAEEDKDMLKSTFKQSFAKNGNKRLISILAEEFRDVELKMGINVAGKQKNLANLSDKLLSVFQFAFANPAAFQQAMSIPALAKSFNDILEFSGMSQADFTTLASAPIAAPPQAPQPGQPAPALALNPTAEAA